MCVHRGGGRNKFLGNRSTYFIVIVSFPRTEQTSSRVFRVSTCRVFGEYLFRFVGKTESRKRYCFRKRNFPRCFGCEKYERTCENSRNPICLFYCSRIDTGNFGKIRSFSSLPVSPWVRLKWKVFASLSLVLRRHTTTAEFMFITSRRVPRPSTEYRSAYERKPVSSGPSTTFAHHSFRIFSSFNIDVRVLFSSIRSTSSFQSFIVSTNCGQINCCVPGNLVTASGCRPIILPVAPLLLFSRRTRGLIWIHNRAPRFPEHVNCLIQYTRRFRCTALLRVAHAGRRGEGWEKRPSTVLLLNSRIAPIGNLESIVSLQHAQSRSFNDSNGPRDPTSKIKYTNFSRITRKTARQINKFIR